MDAKSSTLTIPEIIRTSPVPVSDKTLRRAILDGRLPAFFILGKYRVTTEDLDRFLKAAPAFRHAESLK